MSRKKANISIFFPCYNDAKSIKKLIENSFTVLKKIPGKHEVIVVDDCSTDKSRKILINLSKKYAKLKLIFHKKNLGYGGALKSGFKACTKKLIFYTDGDGQYNVNELPILLSLMTDDVNFVNGIKMTRKDPTYRIVIGNIYSFVVRWLFWIPIYDVDCDFRLIQRKLIKKLSLKSNSGTICVELVKKAHLHGAKFRQVSIHHYERSFGQSQFFRVNRILSTFLELFKLWLKLMIVQKIRSK